MIVRVSDIMKKDIQTIDFYDGLVKAERLINGNHLECLPVMKDGVMVGTLALKDISKAHPNRIVADAMNRNILSVSSGTSIWKARKMLEENSIDILPVVDDDELVGLITQAELLFELGKHFDLLTGLYRSDYLYYQGMELLAKGNEISVIFIDLNKFGTVDKEYGHTQGDVILKELGTLLNNNSPADTYLCRYGGDEFVLLTPYDPDKCAILAENLIKAIAGNIFSNNLFITASAGIAGGRRQKERSYVSPDIISDLINMASLASTNAKREKKNIVVAKSFTTCEDIA